MQTFLVRFFQIYTGFAANPFYIFGESYAGHYIPALTSLLISNYSQNNIRIQGVGVGDGWTHPFI